MSTDLSTVSSPAVILTEADWLGGYDWHIASDTQWDASVSYQHSVFSSRAALHKIFEEHAGICQKHRTSSKNFSKITVKLKAYS